MTGTLYQQIQCVRREISMRVRVYPAWVRNGKMHAAEADNQLSLMRDVLASLEKLAAWENSDPKDAA